MAIYSKAEKTAYNMGKAYKLAKQGRKVKFKTKSSRTSFANGFKSVKGKKR